MSIDGRHWACSFCGAADNDARYLIAAQWPVCICDKCNLQCSYEIIRAQAADIEYLSWERMPLDSGKAGDK